MTEIPANARHRLVLARDLDRVGADGSDLRRLRDRGELVRVRRGCYMPRPEWEVLTSEQRHIARAHAVAANASIEPVFSHFTAAALHGIPIAGPHPREVHVTIPQGAARRRQVELTSHSLPLGPEQVGRVDGLLVTSRERTLVDLCTWTTLQSAVVSVDWGLARGVSRLDLHAELERLNPTKRRRAAEQVIEFADSASGSPGESVSRAGMLLLGFEIPDLQVALADQDGFAGTVDFFWPSVQLIGEFDGMVKYSRDEYLKGDSPAEAVVREKVREDRLRATGRGFLRWGWDVANDLRGLGDLLRRAGVPMAH
jgi:hypothetical protein